MLTTNSEADIRGAAQSVHEMEDRFNHKHKYPWVFLNDRPFSDEFKAWVLSSFLTILQANLGTRLGRSPFWVDPRSGLESAPVDR
jgi:hypothetical protein